MEALVAVRETFLSKQIDSLVKHDGLYDFGSNYGAYPETYKTPYKSQEGKGAFYNLDTIVFFAKRLGTGFRFGEYVRAAKEAGVETIKLMDRKHLEDYLTGKIDSSEYILPDQLPLQDSSAAGVSEGRGQKRPLTAGPEAHEEDDALKTIVSNELRLRNRNTMLSVPGRSFDTVINVLEHVAREELQQAVKAGGMAKSVTAPRSSGRFQRETTTDAAVKQMGAGALGIQNVGFGGAQAPKPMRRAQPAEEQTIPVKQPLVVPRPMSKVASPTKPKATPLILVPPASSAILNMYNIREFLEKGVFVPPDVARSKTPKKPVYERCMRLEGKTKPVKYHITDKDPTKKEDWDRLVAVCCLGKTWQFKKWPFKGASSGDMVDTFLRVAGVFFHFADEPIDPLVKQWNVKMIPISRHTRDTDEAAMRAFWSHMDAFLSSRQRSNVLF